MRLSGKIPAEKLSAAQELAKDMATYKVIAVADLVKVRSTQVQETRRKLRGKVKVLVTKNMLFKKAAETAGERKKNMANFADALSGPNLFLFSELDPFQLTILLDKSKVKVPAKVGDMATSEIMIPAGNTGLPPGPIISEFGEAKVPTKIESGSIWVTKDTVVARKGDVISAKLASVLSKLGIKPIEAGISLKTAYDDGSIFNRDDLQLDLKSYQDDIASAAKQGLELAIHINYLTPETAPTILSNAQRQAMWLAVKSEFPAELAMPDILRQAFQEMKALSANIASISEEAAPTSYEPPGPVQVIAPKLESITIEPEPVIPKPAKEEKPGKEEKPRRIEIPQVPPIQKIEEAPKATKPLKVEIPKPLEPQKKEEPIREAKPREVKKEPERVARKKPSVKTKETRPKKKTTKEKVEKKEKAKKEKTRSR